MHDDEFDQRCTDNLFMLHLFLCSVDGDQYVGLLPILRPY